MSDISPLRRTLSLAISNSVGFSGTTAMALWITVIGTTMPVESWWGSVVGSSQLFAAAFGNFIAPYLFRRLTQERLARNAALLAMTGNIVMAVATIPAIFAAAATIVGLALGMLLSCVNSLLARSESVQGSYATAQICEVGFAAFFYLVGSRIIAAFGLQAIFALLVALCLLSASLMHGLARNEATPRDRIREHKHGPGNLVTLMAAAAFTLFFVGQAAFYQHQIAIAQLIGINAEKMGSLMATAMIGGFIGAFSGKLIGERFGIVKPPALTCALMMLCLLSVVYTKSKFVFALCDVSIQGLTMATVPYAFAILAKLDPSGRLPARGPALLLAGVAGGPLLSETFLRLGGYSTVGWAAAFCVVVAGFLFVMSGTRAVRKNDAIEQSVPCVQS